MHHFCLDGWMWMEVTTCVGAATVSVITDCLKVRIVLFLIIACKNSCNFIFFFPHCRWRGLWHLDPRSSVSFPQEMVKNKYLDGKLSAPCFDWHKVSILKWFLLKRSSLNKTDPQSNFSVFVLWNGDFKNTACTWSGGVGFFVFCFF